LFLEETTSFSAVYQRGQAVPIGGLASPNMVLGKTLRWDPATETLDAKAANAFKDRPAWRAPWTL
jgi:hypothetical protein